MIVVMKSGVSESVVQQVAERVEAMGLKAHVIVGTDMIDATLWLAGRPENHPVQTNKHCLSARQIPNPGLATSQW